jgi:hypothetical protein
VTGEGAHWAVQHGGASEAIKSLVALAGGIAGLWFILRMALAYQRDFTDRYAERVHELDDRVDMLEAEAVERDRRHDAQLSELRLQIVGCGQREARLRLALIEAGINIPDA